MRVTIIKQGVSPIDVFADDGTTQGEFFDRLAQEDEFSGAFQKTVNGMTVTMDSLSTELHNGDTITLSPKVVGGR